LHLQIENEEGKRFGQTEASVAYKLVPRQLHLSANAEPVALASCPVTHAHALVVVQSGTGITYLTTSTLLSTAAANFFYAV